MTKIGPRFLGGRCVDCNDIFAVVDRRKPPSAWSANLAIHLTQRMKVIRGMTREHRKHCRGRGTETKA